MNTKMLLPFDIALSRTGYTNKDKIKEIIQNEFSNIKKAKLFLCKSSFLLSSSNNNYQPNIANDPNIFFICYELPVDYNHQVYDVTILIYLPLDFPNVKPELFFASKENLITLPEYLTPNRNDLHINSQQMYDWNSRERNISELLLELNIAFANLFPCYNGKVKTTYTGACRKPLSYEEVDITMKKIDIGGDFYKMPSYSQAPINNMNKANMGNIIPGMNPSIIGGNVPGMRNNSSSISGGLNIPGLGGGLNIPGMSSGSKIPGMSGVSNIPGMRNTSNIPGMSSGANIPGMRSTSSILGMGSGSKIPGMTGGSNIPGMSGGMGMGNVGKNTSGFSAAPPSWGNNTPNYNQPKGIPGMQQNMQTKPQNFFMPSSVSQSQSSVSMLDRALTEAEVKNFIIKDLIFLLTPLIRNSSEQLAEERQRLINFNNLLDQKLQAYENDFGDNQITISSFKTNELNCETIRDKYDMINLNVQNDIQRLNNKLEGLNIDTYIIPEDQEIMKYMAQHRTTNEYFLILKKLVSRNQALFKECSNEYRRNSKNQFKAIYKINKKN